MKYGKWIPRHCGLNGNEETGLTLNPALRVVWSLENCLRRLGWDWIEKWYDWTRYEQSSEKN